MSELRLLVVDDDDVDRSAIRRAVAVWEPEAVVEDLPDGKGLSGALASRHFDCVLLDHELPGESGLDVVRRLRQAGIQVPILALTGADDTVGSQIVAAGATDFLPKSDLEPRRLVRRIRHAVRLGRAEARQRAIQRELGAERRLLAAVIEQMPAGVLIAKAQSGEVLYNPQLEKLLGFGPGGADIGGFLARCRAAKTDGSVYRPEEWPISRALMSREAVLAEEMSCGTVELRASAAPVYDDDGDMIAAVMTLDDVTEERKAQRAVERAANVREEILAIVSHDLLNPLNSIGIAVEQLAQPEIDTAGREKYAAAIRRSLARADRLIRDLLDAAIIEAGRLRIEPRAVSVRHLLAQVVHDHELQAQQAETPLRFEVGSGVEKVRADRDRTVQVLANLLGNAFRYGPGGAGIVLSAEHEDGRVRFSVCDSGPGIPADVLPYIFDRYYQGNRVRRAGAGLGLAIAKGIVEAHGGTIGVDNEPRGGARFWFTLPAT
ncbi:MAG TPA: ATP-binding protein [Polyangia bacterium]|nr:ATP-binding protein [Polyangia bacterium]